jgi:hypothetical protein
VGVVFPANLLESLAEAPPESLEDFMNFPGMRRWRVEQFGREILQTLHCNGDQKKVSETDSTAATDETTETTATTETTLDQ